jgi:hypothetical protein
MHVLHQQLRGLTHREGVVEFYFEGYQPVTNTPPTCARCDSNPLDREGYLTRRMGSR